MKIFACQLDIVWENKAANHQRVDSLLQGLDIPAGSLVVLPEMFSSGFTMNFKEVAEGTGASSETFVRELARRLGVFVVAGIVTQSSADRGRNEALVMSPEGAVVARYVKMQPFTLGGEAQHYAAGSEVVTFPWNGFIVAPFVCYDLRFPELFRAAVCAGATMFTVIASWPAVRIQHWVTLLQARAIENQAFVVGVNRAGQDPTLTYPGRSLVVNPGGEILADAGAGEGIVSAEVDPEQVRAYRAQLPFLQDMRPEMVKK